LVHRSCPHDPFDRLMASAGSAGHYQSLKSTIFTWLDH
jgi:hypothetical protein